jgi:hypothetical protein
MTTAFPLGAGFAQCTVAYRRIHFRMELARTPNMFPNAFMDTPWQ